MQIQTKFLEDGSVTSAKIATGAVGFDELASGAITGQTAETSADNADLILIYDDSATALKKMTRANFVAGISGASPIFKEGVQLVSTSNIDLSGEETIDNVLTSASRVLVIGQTDPAENGIYVSGAGAWTRASDMNADAEVFRGMQVYVVDGDVHGHSNFALATAGPFTLGTTGLSFYKLNEWAKYDRTLDSTDITNEYIDLAYEAAPNTLDVMVDGVMQDEGTDYSLSVVSNVTRITFIGDLDPTGGASALIVGDVVRTKFQIKR